MLNWFRKKNVVSENPIRTDIHSHLLPGLDDGVQSFEDAEEIILRFIKAGYKKLITTPHIMSDAYRNTPEGIRARLAELKEYLKSKNIGIEIEAAAEYYLDEVFIKHVETDQELLTFGKRLLLFETNFMTEPLQLKEFIFMATTKGYQLVLAHPERYIFLQNDLAKAEDLINRGVYFQINTSSLTGYYSREAQRTAYKLIDKGWVHFVGSDCHSLQHIQLLEEAQTSRYYQKALTLPLLNNSL
ncbi:MAG: capsular biosynthesis protein [Cyclobacteriaceae bacterium]|nr:MAG: capsular biosynthesis protein [Cyclobacteriaceae bacterium]